MFKAIINKVIFFCIKVRLRKRGVFIGSNTVFSKVLFKGKARIESGCRIFGDPEVVIGENFYMNAGCHILGEVEFGRDVLIGPQTIIWGRDHGIRPGVPINRQKHVKKPILIGDDVWIAARVTILKGVSIGSGAVIGAGAIVVKDVPSNAIVVGNPARVIGNRFESSNERF